MRTLLIVVLLMTWAAPGTAAKPAKPAKAAAAKKAPTEQKLSCRTGPNDEQVRLIARAVRGTVQEFAFYSRLGTRVCSIHAQRGDAYTKWLDDRRAPGNASIKLLSGRARIAYKPGHVVLKFFDVERMPYCGMDGELNGTVELVNKKAECRLERIFQASANSEPDSYGSMVALSKGTTASGN
jgi:hypothetical protein